MRPHPVARRPAVCAPGWLQGCHALFALASRLLRGSAALDVEMMPDHLKRDLGLLDGRDPRYDDERLR